ncbi:MAG: LysR family transcriptional regulator [Boseongicola sp.]|nr:MAG: LysR family transcriptional regulator [Boseongicola sp.]
MLGADFLNLDFAALRTLRTVYRLNSFSAAAQELGVNQSTISYTIERLRRAFDDRLFVRQGSAIVPTSRCSAMMADIDHIWTEAERVAEPQSFDPSAMTGSFTIMATFLSRAAIMPRVARKIAGAAPDLHIKLVSGFASARDELLKGRIDIALTPIEIDDSGVYRQNLLTDQYACAINGQNDLATQEFGLKEYANARHLVVNYGPSWQPLYLKKLKEQGLDVKVAFTTGDPADIPHLLQGSDMISTVPSWIARQFPQSIAVRPCPVLAKTEIKMYWTAGADRSPISMWIRNLIATSVQEMSQEFSELT